MANQITPNPSVPSQVVQEVKFPRFVNNLGIIPTSYKDSMSYYECLAWLCKYLEETVIPTLNQNGEAVEELQGLYIQLNNFVDDYFENLDVQEEINNKLDQLVESGELQTLVTNYFDYITQQEQDFENEINASIGDKNKLLTLNNKSIVEAINNNEQIQELFMGNGIFYDISDDLVHVQGNCINENILYVAVQGNDGVHGTIFLFNIISNTYVGKYENVLMYHGNDLTYLNGKIYIASYDSLKVCIYDTSNNTSTEIDPFTDYYASFNHILGVEKFGNDHILCWIRITSPENTLTYDKLLKLNINSFTFTEIEFRDPYKLTTFSDYVTRQNFCISNNDIYFLMIQPNIIYHGYFDTDSGTDVVIINNIYNIPAKDINNNPIGEVESIATIDNNNYPEGSLMLTGRGFQTTRNINETWGEDTICNYIIAPKTGITRYANVASGYFIRAFNNFGYMTVGKTATNNSLIELGTMSYPFKSLIRGINSAISSKAPMLVQINDSGSYAIPFLYGIKNITIQVNNNCNPTIYLGTIENCNINFTTYGNGTFKFKSVNNSTNRISIVNSDITFFGGTSDSIIFNEVQIEIKQCSTFKCRRAKFLNTASVSSHYAFVITDTSYVMLNFSNTSIHSDDKMAQIGGGSVLATDISSSSIDKLGIGLLLTLS